MTCYPRRLRRSSARTQISKARTPELKEFEAMADCIFAAGYCGADELIGAPDSERAQLFKISPEGRAGWARLFRKMLGAKAPPTEAEVKKSEPFKEIDIFATIEANQGAGAIGDISRPRQRAVRIFSEALNEGNRGCPPYILSAPPKLNDFPRALRDPANRGAAECEKAPRRRNSVETSSWNAGQLALAGSGTSLPER